MSKIITLAAAALALVTALPHAATAGSETRIYPYATSHNFCPAGLQPVTMDGSISCGTPNQHISYQQAKAHPVTSYRRHHATHQRHHSARAHCQIGTKGCTYD
jgi:hypothetical protein